MKVLINNKELIKLYETGKSLKLRLPDNVIDKFFATMQKIESASDIYDLWRNPSLKFEKMKGSQNSYSVRLTGKYRLELDIDWNDDSKTTGTFFINSISTHYGD